MRGNGTSHNVISSDLICYATKRSVIVVVVVMSSTILVVLVEFIDKLTIIKCIMHTSRHPFFQKTGPQSNFTRMSMRQTDRTLRLKKDTTL